MNIPFLVAAATVVVASSPVLAASAEPVPVAVAPIADATGASHGMARIVEANGVTTLMVDLTGMPAGVHGMHLHATGSCGGANFAGAGAHLNPAGHEHGTLNPHGSHLGDLPNVTASASGDVHASLELPMRAAALREALFDADGTALVIHAGPDDYRTDPAGGSGARIACGVFARP